VGGRKRNNVGWILFLTLNIPQIDKVKEDVLLRRRYSEKLSMNATTPPNTIMKRAGEVWAKLAPANKRSLVKNSRPGHDCTSKTRGNASEPAFCHASLK